MRELKCRAFYRGVMYNVQEISMFLDGSFGVDKFQGEKFSPDSEHISEIMFFTGLYDKKGKEIYDGDILHWLAIEFKSGRTVVSENVVVSYDEEGARFVVDLKGMDENLFQDRTKRWEKVGNIYENPKLVGANNE